MYRDFSAVPQAILPFVENYPQPVMLHCDGAVYELLPDMIEPACRSQSLADRLRGMDPARSSANLATNHFLGGGCDSTRLWYSHAAANSRGRAQTYADSRSRRFISTKFTTCLRHSAEKVLAMIERHTSLDSIRSPWTLRWKNLRPGTGYCRAVQVFES